VEDNKISQAVMVRILKGLGFDNVEAACDGAQAVALVKNRPFSYHAILMDINLPVLDGVGATKKIRSMNLGLPIIAMTANALKGDAETYLSKGMDAYIPKPVDRERLIQTLLILLG
jgi:osomolarity two-component system sensor histidine kinase TcsA